MADQDSKNPRSNRLVIGLALAGAVTFSAACHGPLKPGLDALAAGNYARAEQHAEKGLKKEQNDPELNLLMADALVGEDRYKEAEPYARRAFEANEPETRGAAARTLGKILWELEQPVEAVTVWETARSIDVTLVPDEDYGRALERAIEVAEKRSEVETELALRRELRTVAPEHAEATDAQILAARERHAKALVREGNYERAVAVYEELSQENPQEAGYPFERGRLLATLGDDERSIAAFDEFVNIGDEQGELKRVDDVAARAESLGAFNVAVHFYNRAINTLPDKPSRKRANYYRRLAGLLLSAGDEDRGKRHLQDYVTDSRALGAEPVSAEIFISAATVATTNRHPDLALDLLEEAIKDAAPSWRASRKLAELYARRARTDDVERVLRTYVERADSTTTAQVVVGEWAANRRNFELARFFLETAVQDSSVSADVWLQLARIYSALGFMDEVRRSLNTYTKKMPDKRRALLDVATIYRAQRMYDEAEDALRDALKRAPEDLLVVKLLEDLYREWGRPKKVHEVYERWAKARGNRAEDLQLIGERFFRQQEWDDALPYLIKAAKAGETDAWLQIADIYNRQRKERDMKEALDEYLDAASDRARALNAVLQRYRVSNWNYEAIPILEELIKLEPRNVLHYEHLSQLYFDQGRDVEAFELWKRYISLSDNPIASLEEMARRFRSKQHQDWMLQFLHQVLERETDPDPRIYRLLGDTYSDLWANQRRMAAAAQADSIFTQENKAKQYYARYLSEAEPSRGDLQTFAESMRQKQMWTIAAEAYEKLNSLAPLQSHQLLNYGIVLLNLGQAERAEAIFADYYDRRNGSVDAALAISDQLFSARRYVSVEPYLRAMLKNGDESFMRQAFMRLAEVYRNSDQTDKIPALIADFLDLAQNPAEARRNVQMMLEAAGMWDEAAEQLERITELQGDEAGLGLGQNLYRAGKRDRADDAFRDYASANVNPAEAWAKVAEFYETRGEVEKARNAYQNAANAAPQSDQAHADLGRYLILTGRLDEGRAAFERARSNIPHNQRGSLFRTEVETLLNAGQFGPAREVARDAVAVAYLDRDYFFEVLASVELDSGDAVRSQRMVDELKSANLPLTTVVRLLKGAGYIEQAADLIDNEIANGDYILGGDVLLQNTEVFTRIGGIDRLMRTAQPLLERSSRDARVPRQLGLFLVEEGHLDQGAMLLRQALELGDTTLRSTLAEVYASLGHHDEAFEMLQADLAAYDGPGRRAALGMLGYRYEILGERARFQGLLEHLVRDTRFAAEAVPYLVRYLVADGQVALVVDTVQRLAASHDPTEQSVTVADDRGTEIAIAALVSGVEELAIGGFEAEARALLASAPESLGEREEARDLRLRLAAFAQGGAPDSEFKRALAVLGDSNSESQQRLRVAELAVAAGRYELATEIAQSSLRSADFGVSTKAMRVLLRTASAARDTVRIDAVVDAYLATNTDRMSARSAAVSELLQLGLDGRALKIAEEQAEKVPIYGHVRDALTAAQRAGDAQKIARWSRRLIEVDRQNPAVALQHNLFTWSLRQHDDLNQPLRDALAGTFDELLAGRRTEIMNLYRLGKPFEARAKLEADLKAVDFDPAAVESYMVLLDRYKLWGEIARVVAPKVPNENFTIPARRLVGLANMSLGFDSEGLAQLDRTIAAAPDPAHEAANIADELLLRRRFQSALRFAESSMDRRPTRPEGRRIRGLARLATGDLQGATDDLDEALAAGINRTRLLHRASVIALRTGQAEFARSYLDDLLEAHQTGSGLAAPLVVDAFDRADAAKAGVEFIENTRPELVAGEGIGGMFFLSQLSQLYEAAGNPERGFEVYQAGIRRLQFTNPFSNQLATFHNNLAYSYSTTNRNVDVGFDLVRRAIAQNPNREASYIDTLGWLMYRAGDFAAAEEEIRRAIRSSDGTPGEMEELYRHLAVLRAAQGYHGEAVWMDIFAESVQNPSQ